MDSVKLKCCKCNQEKETTEFTIRRGSKRGYCYYCKPCYRIYSSLRLSKKGITNSQLTKLRRIKCHEKYMLSSVKSNAKYRGISFSLKLEDINIPDVCPVLKCPIIREGGVKNMYSPSIDRLDNSKGYHKDNIQVVSRLANIMKNCSTSEELHHFCNYHLERLSNLTNT